jgi:hypothetical protein
MCLSPPIFLLEQGLDARVCETARAVTAGSASELDAAKAIVWWESRNIENMFNTSTPCYRPDTAQHPLWSFVSRCGACDEYATLFSRMVGCLGIESRVARDEAENHHWAEVLVGGDWVVIDPAANNFNLSADAYEKELGQNISYVAGRYANGTEVDLTSRYTATGRLTVSVPGGGPVGVSIDAVHGRDVRPTNARCEVASGSCSVALGGNEYAVRAVRYGILPLFDEKTVELKEDSALEVSLSPGRFDLARALALLPRKYVVLFLIALLSVLIWVITMGVLFLLKKQA